MDKLATKIDKGFLDFATDVAKIQGVQRKPIPTWLTHIVAPIIVTVVSAAVIGAIPAYIHLNNRLSNIEGYMHDNGALVTGLRLQLLASKATRTGRATGNPSCGVQDHDLNPCSSLLIGECGAGLLAALYPAKNPARDCGSIPPLYAQTIKLIRGYGGIICDKGTFVKGHLSLFS